MEKTKDPQKVFFNNSKLVFPTEEFQALLDEAKDTLMVYECAIKEISTKLEVLNIEFQKKARRNPIEYIKSRVKSPQSILVKMRRKGLDMSLQAARENLYDIAGVRVVCSYVDDIYMIAGMLLKQDDVILLREKDYIKFPKPNGYRSLHIVVQIPVFFSDRVEKVPVEIQIRTIAMDFWASLEHQLHYKTENTDTEAVVNDLKTCADVIAATDLKMQQIHYTVEKMEAK